MCLKDTLNIDNIVFREMSLGKLHLPKNSSTSLRVAIIVCKKLAQFMQNKYVFQYAFLIAILPR